jgi:hypothetical protein
VVEIFTAPSFKAIFLELSRLVSPAKVGDDLFYLFYQTSEPLISKASATRPTATTIAAVLRSTEYFFETLWTFPNA